ncbi:MAG TPA: hypothetical protein PKX23_14345 [Verrucomicrobiota bacterium]|nr:hypothetical protein [Verrucomicrobiota bacterium]HRT08379.1 hypothetical protein [Candidatus Paceibacterota bacterium]
MRAHLFWWFLMLAVMVWYSTVTIYVTIRGVMDIRQMLRRLKDSQGEESPQPPPFNKHTAA